VHFVYYKPDGRRSMDFGVQKLWEIDLYVIVGSSPKLFLKIGVSIQGIIGRHSSAQMPHAQQSVC
jgi:hypothetical protein